MDNDWRSDKFRQAMVAKLAEGLRELQAVAPNYNNPAKHSPEGFEQQAFNRSKSREEYISMFGRIVSAFKREAQQAQQLRQQGQAGNPQAPEPHQIQQPGQHQQHGQHFPPNQGQQNQPQMMAPRMAGVPMQQPTPGQMQQQPGQWQQGPQPGWDGQRPQGPPQQGPQGQMQMTPEARMQLQHQHNQRMMMAQQRAPGVMPVGPQQGQPKPGQMPPRPYQMPPQPNQQHPGQNIGQPAPPQMPPHGIPTSINQPQVPSPGGFVPSPASNHMQQPSLMGAAGSSGPRSVPSGVAPSPIGDLRTPGSAAGAGGGGDEEAAYVQKIQQLQKYIEPLRQMIAGMNASDKQNLNKMNKLYEILTNPQRRIPMPTLLRSEEVLEKMFEKMGATGGESAVDTSAVAPPSGAGGMNPLLESVFRLRSSEQKSQAGPGLSHALNRSMRAPLEAIFGNDITLPPLPKKMRMGSDALTAQSSHEESTPEIPDVLQGEVARLQPQFKVSLDPAQASTGPSGLPGMPRRRILLICQLEDKDLPSVPALSVTIPPNYPENASPVCAGFNDDCDDGDDSGAVEYTFTPFLIRVKEALTSRLNKMPTRFSLSQLLSAWEMSVRAASNVRQTQNPAPRPVAASV